MSGCTVMVDVLRRSGYAVLEQADYDAMLLELAKLKGLERAVRTMAVTDCAARELLTTLNQ